MLQVLNTRGIPALALIRDTAAWNRMGWATALANVTALTDESALPEQLGGVIHLAALVRHSRKNARELYSVNIEGTLHALHLAEQHRCRMVYASSSGVVGCFSSPDRIAYEDAPYATDEIADWPYYHSKAVAERRLRERASELGVKVVIVRPPVLLGPGDHRFRSTGNLIRYLRGRLPFLIEGGMHFADVRDVAAAIVRALEHPSPRPIYHLPGTISSIREFFALAEEVSGARAPRRTLPAGAAWWVARLLAPLHVLPDPVVIEMAGHYWSTGSRYAADDLGYLSRDPAETMRDTIEWLRENHPGLRSKVG